MGRNWTQVLQDRNAGLVEGFGPERADVDDRPLEDLKRDELLEEAERRGVTIENPRATKAEIIAALEGE